MSETVNRRRYDASRRRAAAQETRLRILRAARALFVERGYAATSVSDIAEAAGVSVDTLYASVGRKPQLLLAVHDMELAGGGPPVEAEQRDYVKRIRETRSAAGKIEVYAASLGELLPRTVPLLEALREAGRSDPECDRVYRAVSERRAAHMLAFAQDLRSTGEVRDDIDDATVAALVWSMNSPEYFRLLESLGRTPDQYAALVRDVWSSTLLRSAGRRRRRTAGSSPAG